MPIPVEKANYHNPASDHAYQLRIGRMLVLPFNRQDAYHLGIIDADGNSKKKPVSENEKASYTPLHEMVFGLKKYILSTPSGFSFLSRLSSALNTVNSKKNSKMDPKSVSEEYEKSLMFINENNLRLVLEEAIISTVTEEIIAEEEGAAPTTNTTSVTGVDLPLGSKPKKRKIEDDDTYTEVR